MVRKKTGSPLAAKLTEQQANRAGAALALAACAAGLALAAMQLVWPAGPMEMLLSGLFLVLAFAGGLLLRQVPRRLNEARRVLDAVRSADREGIDPEQLRVEGESTPESRGWNRLLDELSRKTQQRTAEQAREQLTERRTGNSDLESICDAMSEGLMLISDRSRVRYANGAAAVFLKTDRETLVGSLLSDFVEESEVIEAVESIVAGQGSPRMGIEVRREGEEGTLRFGVRPVRREDAAAAMVTIHDITQQKVADDARNSFLAQATHELRAPLTNIRLYVETAIDEGQDDLALQGKCLNVINDEARRLERVVNDILSVSEIEAGSFDLRRDDVPLQAMLQELQGHYQAQAAEKGVQLNFELPLKLPVLVGDRDKIMLALHNLLSNAIKYTSQGGSVTLKAELAEGNLQILVSDTGIGMSEEDAGRVFDKFYRAKDERIASITGSGLGLSLAREVIRLHGGDIDVQSVLNEGSTFTLRLPAPNEAA